MTKKYQKSRIWASVGYPESLPVDWKEKLIETGLQIAISPLHDKDVDPTGESKKPHYHIIFNYEGPTTYEHMKEICDSLNLTIPIKLESLRGMYRYHLHLDNPEKYQYSDKDRRFFNGFDVNKVDALTYTEINQLLTSIQQFIVKENIFEYCDLLDKLLESESYNLLDVARNHTLMINAYISSRRNKIKSEVNKILAS